MKSIIKWLFFVAIFVAIIIFGLRSAKQEVYKNKQDDIKTEMLEVQGMSKVVLEKYNVSNDNGLKGEKMEDTQEKEKYGIEDISNYYKWDKNVLTELGISEPKLNEGEYYLINYDAEEVIYSEGYIAEDGNTYYKLSEIKEAEVKAKEEQESAEEPSNTEESQNAEEVKEDDGEGTDKAE